LRPDSCSPSLSWRARPFGRMMIDQRALERAHNFLKTEEHGGFILGHMHFVLCK